MSKNDDEKNLFRLLQRDRKSFKNKQPWLSRLLLTGLLPKKDSTKNNRVKLKAKKPRPPKPRPSKLRQAISYTAAALTLSVILFWIVSARLRPSLPSFEPSPELTKQLNLLFMAINSHDSTTIGRVGKELAKLEGNGKVDDQTGKFLRDVMDSTVYNEWEPAAERIYNFILQPR